MRLYKPSTALALRKRKRAPRLGQNARYCGCPQGRKAKYTEGFISALTVYQKLLGFRYAQQMLAVLASLNQDVPAPSTFAERKAGLMGQLILAVKQLCSGVGATRQHLDSKKLEVVDMARANRTKLSGRYGHDHIHKTPFYGFRRLGQSGTSRACPLHARVDDTGSLCEVLLPRRKRA